MESQHSPRFRGGAELPCVQPSLPSPEPGKALKSHRVEEKGAGKARYSPEQCQGSGCSLPERHRGFKHVLDARWSPGKTSAGGVFMLKPMNFNLLGFFYAQSPGLALSTPLSNRSL